MKNQFQNEGYLILKEAIDKNVFEKLKLLSNFYIDRTYKR